MKKELYELRDTGEQFDSVEKLMLFCKEQNRLTASYKKVITETKEEYEDVAIQYDDKIVFTFREMDFEYCRDSEDILIMLADTVNDQLNSRGINIEVVLEPMED